MAVFMPNQRRIIGITGASGTIYGRRLLRALLEHVPDVRLGVVVFRAASRAMPGFYSNPKTIGDLVDLMVMRILDQMGLRVFGAEFRALMERARTGKSLPDDLSGGTFTITNLGMYEIDAFTPIINLPEAAILGVGRIQPKAVVRDGEIVARQMWTLSLVFDHRLVDGAPAARFLQRIKQLVENPFLLLG